MIVYDSFVVVPVRTKLVKLCPVDICILYQLTPAQASDDPLRDRTILLVTRAAFAGVARFTAAGAVVSNTICFATLYGLIFPMLNNVLIFFTPSPGVKLIAWSVYGNGINNGTPIIVGFIFPFIAAFTPIFAYSAAWICVVFV